MDHQELSISQRQAGLPPVAGLVSRTWGDGAGEGSYGLWRKRCPGLRSTLPPVTQNSQTRPFSFH